MLAGTAQTENSNTGYTLVINFLDTATTRWPTLLPTLQVLYNGNRTRSSLLKLAYKSFRGQAPMYLAPATMYSTNLDTQLQPS
jgi:hypothetical protein